MDTVHIIDGVVEILHIDTPASSVPAPEVGYLLERPSDEAHFPGMLWDGEVFSLPPAPDPADLPVPFRVSRMQARLALHNADLLTAVDGAIASSSDEGLKIYWADVSWLHRDHIAVAAVAAGLGWTSEQLDQLFRDAAQIV